MVESGASNGREQINPSTKSKIQNPKSEYASSFDKEMGAPGKLFRMALGALIIKEKLGTSDRETVEQIQENPYLQYFIGMTEF
jgi:hypothetical protein